MDTTRGNEQTIFRYAGCGLALADGSDSWIIEEMNPALAEMHGCAATEISGKSLADLTAPEALVEMRGHMVLSEVRNRHQFESLHLDRTGRRFPVQIEVTNVMRDDGGLRCRVLSVRDISERKEVEAALSSAREKLRALSAHQETLLEEERKRIAREVHDELGQKLVAMQMGLSYLRLRYGDNPALHGNVEDLQALVEDTIDVVRHVASNLRPAALDLGLGMAIEWLAEDFGHRWEIPCKPDIESSALVLDDALATAVFRVVQESLTNIARHAQAKAVSITLRYDKWQLRLEVRDDGRGFDPAVVRNLRGYGLLGMRERILALGGSLRIDSAPGKGTRVMIVLPIPDPSRK